MLRTGFQRPMTHVYEPCTRSAWPVPTWPERPARLRKRTASSGSEGVMKRAWIFLSVVFLLALASCGGRNKNGDDKNTLFVSGRIDGDTVDISSKRDGKLVQIMVREGDTVQ